MRADIDTFILYVRDLVHETAPQSNENRTKNSKDKIVIGRVQAV